MTSAWQTPAELAAELRPDASPEVGERWVREQMRTGRIPSVKVGAKRFFTEACRDEMNRRALEAEREKTEPEGWGQVTRSSASKRPIKSASP